jgi:diguanylate cyclase (GGDEF)-like protein/PAS domain S-box-containing protein
MSILTGLSTSRLRRLLSQSTVWPILALILVLAFTVPLQRMVVRLNNAENAHVRLMRIDRELAGVLQASVDIETGTRGFALTGIADFLAPYEKGSNDLGLHLDRLASLTNPKARLATHAVQVRQTAFARLRASRALIEQVRKRGSATALIDYTEDKRAQDALRRAVAEFAAYASNVSREQQEKSVRFRRMLQLALIISAIMIATFLMLWWRAARRSETARANLRAVEIRSKSIVDDAPYGILTLNRAGRIVSVNRHFCRLLDLSYNEFIATSYKRLLHAGQHDVVVRAAGAMLHSQAVFQEQFCLVRKDGGLIWVRASVSMLRTPDSAGADVLVIADDITEQKLNYEKLRRSEVLVRNAGRLARIDGWSLSWPARQLTIGDVAGTLLGLSQGGRVDVVALTSRMPHADRRKLRAVILACIREGGEFEIEVELDGGDMTLLILGESVNTGDETARIEGALRDVTEQRRSQHALRDSEERFRAIAHVTNDAIWEWDRKGNQVWRTADVPDATGERRDGAMDAWAQRLHPDDRDRVVTSFTTAVQGTADEWSADYRYIRSDGKTRYVLDRAMLLRDAQGMVVRAVGGMIDLTDSHRMQQAMMQMAASVGGENPGDFFRALLDNMVSAMGADAGAIACLSPNGSEARTLAAVVDGERLQNFSYAVSDWPCMVLTVDHECLVPSDLASSYPAAAARFGADAYLGVPLQSAHGEPLGFIFVLYRVAPVNNEFFLSTLRVFASRASAEIERLAADAQLREQAELLNHAQEAIIVLNLDQSVRFWNRGAEQMYGCSSAEMTGADVATTYADAADAKGAMATVLAEGNARREVQQRRWDGDTMWAEERWTLIRNAAGEPYSVLKVSSDISIRKAADEQILQLAHFDNLTGLPNRSLFMGRIEQARRRASFSGYPGALLFIDMDNFKSLNDLHGHNTGDAFLRMAAQRMEKSVRSGDIVARLGGDEFVVIIENLDSDHEEAVAQAQAVAEKLLKALSRPYELDRIRHHSTASIGIALFTEAHEALDILLGQADMAMYAAKAAGRNAYRLYMPELKLSNTANALIEQLHTAVEESQFELWYQPQFDKDGQIYGAEALIRWRHPDRGLLLPGEFITAAEKSSVIIPLGRWVLVTACHQLALWSESGAMASIDMSVNISVTQLREPDFVEQVTKALASSGAPADRLVLEITEGALDEEGDAIAKKIVRLRQRGVRFSLDDFGTGYSSLSRLRRLPLDEIKIDRSFVLAMEDDPTSRAIVAMILTLARTMGLHAVAEGVESEAQRVMLATSGCLAFQGYLLGRPMSPEQLHALLLEPAKRHSEHGLPKSIQLCN